MFWDQSKPAAPRAADEWFSPGRFAALLAALVCLSYPDVVFGWGTFFHRDYAVFGYPLAAYHRDSFWRGEAPLWNPLNYCGVPFLAQWNTMTLYPLSLFYLLLPLSWSLGVFCLGHLFLGGMGMYFLAHRWTNNRLAGAVAGVAFAFNALLLHFLMWPNNIAAMGWLPWVVLAVERAWNEGGRWLLLAAAAGAMQMLSGAPEVILLTWVLLGALFFGQLILARARRVLMCGRWLIVVLWIGSLAAAQLLPFLDLLAHSQRDTGFGDSLWSMPIWGWANFLVPLFRSHRTSLGVYAQPGQYWVYSYYLGVGTLALALLAATQARRPRFFLLGAITALCLLVALGKDGLVYSALKQMLPGLGFMRFPVKFVMLPAVLVPLLAAMSLAACLAATPAQWPRHQHQIITLGSVLVAVIVFLIWFGFHSPLKGDEPPVTAVNGASRVLFLVLTLGLVAVLRRANRPPWEKLAPAGLLLCLWLDVMTAGPRANPTAPRWVYQRDLARKELRLEPPPSLGLSRAMLNAEAESNMSISRLTNAAEQVVYSRLALYADANLLDNLPEVTGMYSLYIRELGEVLGGLMATPQPPAGLADFLAVSHINQPGKITQWDFRPTHQAWVTGGQKAVLGSREEILSGLIAADFDSRQTVFLPLEVRGLISATNSSKPTVSGTRISAHKVEFDVEGREPTLTVISQTFYHNWRAYIGDKPARLLRANHAFQAVEVPAGRQHVKLVYEDRAFQVGAVVSLFSAAVWVTLWLRVRRKQVGKHN